MMDKSPTQVIEDALAKLDQGTRIFPDETTALGWLTNAATQLIRYKMGLNKLSAAEREEADPIEAGYLHAKDMGTRPRRQRIGWIDALIAEVAQACFCEFIPLSGTMSSWLVGRHTDRMFAHHLLNSLVPTAEKLSQDYYFREYHAHRRAGDVEGAQGSKEKWLLNYVEQVKGGLQQALESAEADAELLSVSRREVTDYMNENFLPTRGNKTERLGRSSGKPK